ncbi:MAG: hypothetical protein RJA22_2929 [Verrucomicrobiota bacterium]|jgi:NAD(P)-dependent dehydrogenase (short-subunit alcohol dehydrogenase family)
MAPGMNSSRLAGKTIVIIGGTRGMGWSAAQACRQAGARVVVVGPGDDALATAAQALGGEGLALAGDATHPATAPAAIAAAQRQFHGFDGLYHVAGGSGRRHGDGPLHEISDEGWAYTLELNLTSLFHSNRAAARAFLEQGRGGSVLNMASALGLSPGPRFFATHAYAAAKSAVLGLTHSLAAFYAPHGIRFNALAPGLVDTPMSQRAQALPETMAYARSRQALEGGRIGHPSDLDGAVVYLLSDEARFVTGQTLAIDGGWTAGADAPLQSR